MFECKYIRKTHIVSNYCKCVCSKIVLFAHAWICMDLNSCAVGQRIRACVVFAHTIIFLMCFHVRLWRETVKGTHFDKSCRK
jgi:hypothetical protein